MDDDPTHGRRSSGIGGLEEASAWQMLPSCRCLSDARLIPRLDDPRRSPREVARIV